MTRLLHDLRFVPPDATLVGVDLAAFGLRNAHALVPTARLTRSTSAAEIAGTPHSMLGRISWRLEKRPRLQLPFGIRNLLVLRRMG
jgi:hypothetical protein